MGSTRLNSYNGAVATQGNTNLPAGVKPSTIRNGVETTNVEPRAESGFTTTGKFLSVSIMAAFIGIIAIGLTTGVLALTGNLS